MTTNTATKITGPKPCLCGAFEIMGDDAKTRATYCTELVDSQFRRGHDARLKSLAIRAKRLGRMLLVHLNSGDVMGDPVQIVATYASPTLAMFVADAGMTRRKPTKKAPKPSPAPIGRVFPVKIGRWTYDATVISATGTVLTLAYTTKAGVEMTVIRTADELDI